MFSAFVIGFSAIVVQTIAFRELLSFGSGNELVLGLTFGSWLLLSGVGCWLAARWKSRPLANTVQIPLQLWLAVVSVGVVFAVRGVKATYLLGRNPGLAETFLLTIMILLPYSLISGYTLARLPADSGGAPKVFFWDSLGALAGGLCFSLIFATSLGPVESCMLAGIAHLTAAAVLPARSFRKRALVACCALIGGLLVFLSLHKSLEKSAAAVQFHDQTILKMGATEYGQVVVSQKDGQTSLHENGVLIATSASGSFEEYFVHLALSQHPDPKKVFVLSGGLGGISQELNEYPDLEIDFAELNPGLTRVLRDLADNPRGFEKDRPKPRYLEEDARRFLEKTPHQYDVILMPLPDPSTLSINRYLTEEFFGVARNALKTDGVLFLSLNLPPNSTSQEDRLLASSIFRSIKGSFGSAAVFPGARLVIATAQKTSARNLLQRLNERGIKTSFVNQAFLEATLTPDRISMAQHAVDASAPENHDLRPVSFLYFLNVWFKRAEAGLGFFVLFLFLILAVATSLVTSSQERAPAFALFSSGLTGLSLELALMLIFQLKFGSLYIALAVMIASFMAGMSAGTIVGMKYDSHARLILWLADLGFAALSAAVGLLLSFNILGDDWLAAPVLFAFTVLSGFLGGLQLPSVSKYLCESGTAQAGRVFALDLLGASLGAVLIGALAVPYLGLARSCFVLAGVKALSIIGIATSRLERSSMRISDIDSQSGQSSHWIPWAVLGSLMVLALADDTATWVYALSLHRGYLVLVVLLLTGGVFAAIRPRTVSHLAVRWFSFLVLGLVATFPLARCYFKVPYIFCHVCPRQCAFGILRPYAVPLMLVANLRGKFWCSVVCPLGTCQDPAPTIKRVSLPSLARSVSWLVLLFIIFTYFAVDWSKSRTETPGFDWYNFMFLNRYGITAAVVLSILVFAITSLRWRRPFCNLLCPIGTVSQLYLDLEKARHAE